MNMDACKPGRVGLATLVVLGMALLPGCVSTGSKKGIPEQPPVGAVTQVHSLWQSRIVTTADTVHGGTPLPGLAGRLYLVSQDGASLKGKGKLIVDVIATEPGPDGRPVPPQHYEFPDQPLQRLLKKDGMIGWGYTVFLPWPEYQPQIKRVQLRVAFAPEQGTAVYEPPHQLTLRSDQGPRMEQRVLPVNSESATDTGATIPMRGSVSNSPNHE